MDPEQEKKAQHHFEMCNEGPTYNNTHVIGNYLDRHLVLPLLDFLQDTGTYDDRAIDKAKLDLISKSNMVDFEIQMYQEFHGRQDVPNELMEKREEVLNKLKHVQADAMPILEALQAIQDENNDGEESEGPRIMKVGAAELQKYDIFDEHIEALYHFAKFKFEIAAYEEAKQFLGQYRQLSSDPERSFSALWGKFACEILTQNWETALDDMNLLKDAIDTRNFASPLQQLQQRTWLIHWSLFIHFNHPNGRNGIIDLFFQDRYLNAITTNCPHILRYLTTAVITNKRRRGVLKELLKVIQQERYMYKDPITEFLECLYVKFDFESAQQRLLECDNVLRNDFFLVACREDFIENARLFIFETYCRIHQCIDIGMLASKLSMDQESAERWIVNLVREAHLDAKIDSKNHHVIMGLYETNIYQQVIEKTKGLAFRSYTLTNNLEHRMRNQNQGGRGSYNDP